MPRGEQPPEKRGNDFYKRYKAEGRRRIVAEGDSWFDYQIGPGSGQKPPRRDVLDYLSESHNYAVFRVSKAGDTVGNMVYGKSLSVTLNAIKREKPDYFLFSGGGNDVAGPQMGTFLNHKGSNQSLIRKTEFKVFVKESLETAYRKLLKEVAAVAPDCKVFIHGYDYPIPDGRAVIAAPFWGGIIGPWLLPVFKGRGILDRAEQEICVNFFIDELNLMLKRVAADVDNCFHIDCRGVLSHNRTDWANELHPTIDKGFPKIAKKFHEVIQKHA